MSLSAHLLAWCDGCGLTVERDVYLNKKTADGIMSEDDGVTSWATDLWSWAVPDEWLQIEHDEMTGRDYLFFHDDECYVKWLQNQGRTKEIDEFRNGVWIA